MDNLNERLDKLRALIQDEDFLEGNGLGNEVNIRIFCYNPKEEMTVRHFVEQAEADASLRCRLVVRNLYKVFLSICEDMGISDSIAGMEEADGSDYLLKQLREAVGVRDFVDKLRSTSHENGAVLVLTGVGDVFPFMRVHTLLEAMQKDFSDMPVLVMYPGRFDGMTLKLFDRLAPNDYYRAFNVVD